MKNGRELVGLEKGGRKKQWEKRRKKREKREFVY
jgi:hypothetical protein